MIVVPPVGSAAQSQVDQGSETQITPKRNYKTIYSATLNILMQSLGS